MSDQDVALPASASSAWAEKLRAVVRTLRRYEPVAIYLFGSRARGAAREDSDLDLALLLRNGDELPVDDWLAVTESLRDLAGTEVDLVVLNDALPHVRLEALGTGEVLYETTGADRLACEAMVLKECGDARSATDALARDVEDCLQRLLDLQADTGERFAERPDACALAHHYLWRAVQGAIDLARLIGRASGCLGREGRKVPYREAFTALGHGGLLPPEQVREGRALVTLRNRLVHEYLGIGPEKMRRTLESWLPRLRRILTCLVPPQSEHSPRLSP